ncbi:MAG: holo-ACP synthase [Pseudomonadota bacterium]
MIAGIGVDLMDVSRMEESLQSGDTGLLAELFAPTEIAYCQSKYLPAQHFAARFAAKEAFFKAFGIDQAEGLCWRDVEITSEESGKPGILLHGRLRKNADSRGVRTIHLTLSHTRDMAIAQVVIEVEHPQPQVASPGNAQPDPAPEGAVSSGPTCFRRDNRGGQRNEG